MQGRDVDTARSIGRLTLAILLPLGGLVGCGGGDLRDAESTVTAAGGFSVDSAALADEFGRNVPLVFVDRKKVGGYEYHLQDQLYEEQELLALFRSIIVNDPDVEVGIVPSGVLTKDEIGLLEAKLREAGVQRIRVADSRR